MEGLQKPLGAYLVGIAVVVAVWFIINTFFVNVFEVQDVWYVLDAFMFAGLVLALGFNARRMASEGGPDRWRASDAQVPGGKPPLLPHRGDHDSVHAQLVFSSGPRSGQPGRERSGMDHLGGGGHDAAHSPGRDGLPHVVRRLPF